MLRNLKNKVQLIGNLGKDPEIKDLESGKKVAKFSMATNEAYKDKDGQKIEETQWHNIVAWGKTAEIIEEYVKKGNEIIVEGKLVHRSYEDKDGNPRQISEIVASEILMLNNRKHEAS